MKKFILNIIAVIFLLGGIMGLAKGLFPQLDWLNFRYLLYGDGTFAIGEMPLYVRLYGIVMAVLEIIFAVIIFLWKKKLFRFCITVIVINMIGCIVAVFLGDSFAIISLLLRAVPLFLLVKECRSKRSNSISPTST